MGDMAADPVEYDFRDWARKNRESWNVTMTEEGKQIIANAFRADDRMKAGRRPAA